MLANIQKSIAIAILFAAGALASRFWANSHVAAIAAFILVSASYSVILAMQFAAMCWTRKTDLTPRPTMPELVRAWWAESLTVPQIFCWRQPFFSDAEPNYFPQRPNGQRGVVFVHGFFCNRGLWTPWLTKLRHRGHAFVALNLKPEFGSIDDYAKSIEEAIESVTRATGQAPVLVCHSMGGLAARAWARKNSDGKSGIDELMKRGAKVHHIVTIGTPHRGTWLARFSRAENARQMRLHSHWISRLEQDEEAMQASVGIIDASAHPSGRWTCWYSNCDNIVFPAATATLPRAENHLLRGFAHVCMVFSPSIYEHTITLLDAPD